MDNFEKVILDDNAHVHRGKSIMCIFPLIIWQFVRIGKVPVIRGVPRILSGGMHIFG